MPARRIHMRKIKDVLRLKLDARLSHERIAAALSMTLMLLWEEHTRRRARHQLAGPTPPGLGCQRWHQPVQAGPAARPCRADDVPALQSHMDALRPAHEHRRRPRHRPQGFQSASESGNSVALRNRSLASRWSRVACASSVLRSPSCTLRSLITCASFASVKARRASLRSG